MRLRQSGNMILMLFGAIAAAGVLGTGYMATMKGPGRALDQASRTQSIENNLLAATRLVVSGDAAQQDCDADGIVEPKPYRTGAGPTGGGLVPLDAGAAKNDPWGKALGYCVWDHGKKTRSDNVLECGGSTVNRLQGGNVTTENVLAIVSAGKDGIFQTTCNAWADVNDDKVADTPLVVTTVGSDDIVRKDTIESLLSSGVLSQLPTLPDSACIAGAEGTMRFENGVWQVCSGSPTPSWKEVGGSAGSTGNFTNTSGVNPSTVQTSNAITVGGFFGTRTVTVDNGGTLIINGVDTGLSTGTIASGQTVAIKGTSATFASPATSTATNPKVFTLEIGSISKTWTVTTRGRTAAAITITPNPSNSMNVVGTTGTAYGTPVQFTVTNTGEATMANQITAAPSLTNTTNFELTGTNLCSNVALAGTPGPGHTCTFYVRPKASTPSGAITSTLSVSATGVTTANATLNGTASGWTCTVPGGGTIAHGANVTAYTTLAPAYAGVCSSFAQVRTCTNGVLSGSAPNQYCYQWVVGGWSGCSVSCGGGTQTRSVICQRQAGGATVADGNCGGTKPATSQSGCNPAACCTPVTQGPFYALIDPRYYYSVNNTFFWGGVMMGPNSGPSYVSGGWTYYKGSTEYSANFFDIYRTSICP